MFCLKCGEAIPDGSSVCPKCGSAITDNHDDQAIVYSSQKEQEDLNQKKKHKAFSKKLWFGIVTIALIAAVVLTVSGISKASLRKALVKTWYDVSGSILKVMDINEKTMEYRLETGYRWMDTTLGEYPWKPVSGTKIKIKRFGDKYEIFTVEFNEDKDVLSISPAITSVDSVETWYYID